MKKLIKIANIVNEGKIFKSDLVICDDIIEEISEDINPNNFECVIDLSLIHI